MEDDVVEQFIDELILKADTNKSGAIDFSEFMAFSVDR